jgi:hypothetical protein
MAFFYTWVYNATGSVLLCMVFHGSFNTSTGFVPAPLEVLQRNVYVTLLVAQDVTFLVAVLATGGRLAYDEPGGPQEGASYGRDHGLRITMREADLTTLASCRSGSSSSIKRRDREMGKSAITRRTSSSGSRGSLAARFKRLIGFRVPRKRSTGRRCLSRLPRRGPDRELLRRLRARRRPRRADPLRARGGRRTGLSVRPRGIGGVPRSMARRRGIGAIQNPK